MPQRILIVDDEPEIVRVLRGYLERAGFEALAAYDGPEALRRAGAEVIVINASPDGYNINEACGSTHPEQLQTTVVDTGHPFGGQRARAVVASHDGKARRREHPRRRGAHVAAAKDIGQALGAERLDVRRGNLRGSVGVGDVTPLLHQ